MKILHTLRHVTALAGMTTTCLVASAAPVQLNFGGAVTDYVHLGANLIASYLPLGTAMSLSINFNETFSDGSYDFTDDLGPVSGHMQIGADSWVLNGYVPSSYSLGQNGMLNWVGLQFTGTGPAATGADEFFGVFMALTPALTLAFPVSVGFDYAAGPTGYYQYAEFSGSASVTPVGTVPAPATPALVATALLALHLTRRSRAA